MMILKKNKGFTLAEAVITLAMIGVVAALTIPALVRTKPDKNKMMFKKAYFTLEQTVSQLINNDKYYPVNDSWQDSDERVGFQIFSEADGCGDNNPKVGINYTDKAKKKFACLFEKQLNVISSSNCGDKPGNCIIEGNDGIIWTIPPCPFEDLPLPPPSISDIDSGTTACVKSMRIVVDVNGDKAPNCIEGAKCDNPDRFYFAITKEGRVEIPGSPKENPRVADVFGDRNYYSITREYLRSTNPTKNAKDEKK